METVRDILAAHRSGISRPGLLAWARLRIDPAMTEAQLEEELTRLGDEVIDDEGFLYLRANVEPGRLRAVPERSSGAAGGSRPEGAGWTWSRPESPPSAPPSEPAWPPPAEGRQGGCGSVAAKAIGLAVFVLWAIGFIAGFIETAEETTPDLTPGPSASAAAGTPAPSPAPTPTAGEVIDWPEMAAGDCIVVPPEDTFYEVRRVPCDTPHGGEVIATVSHPGTDYPDDDAFASFATAACEPVVGEWTGTAFDEQELLELWWFTPTSEGWAEGDRTVVCFIAHADGSPMERSYRSGF